MMMIRNMISCLCSIQGSTIDTLRFTGAWNALFYSITILNVNSLSRNCSETTSLVCSNYWLCIMYRWNSSCNAILRITNSESEIICYAHEVMNQSRKHFRNVFSIWTLLKSNKVIQIGNFLLHWFSCACILSMFLLRAMKLS